MLSNNLKASNINKTFGVCWSKKVLNHPLVSCHALSALYNLQHMDIVVLTDKVVIVVIYLWSWSITTYYQDWIHLKLVSLSHLHLFYSRQYLYLHVYNSDDACRLCHMPCLVCIWQLLGCLQKLLKCHDIRLLLVCFPFQRWCSFGLGMSLLMIKDGSRQSIISVAFPFSVEMTPFFSWWCSFNSLEWWHHFGFICSEIFATQWQLL